MRTKSPTQTLGRMRCHFCRDCSWGKYSATQRLQNALTMLWTWRHCFLYLSLSWNTPIGKDILLPSMSKWFGVKGVSSFTSLLHFVSGRPFTTFSTSPKNVWRESSVNLAFLWRIAVNNLRMVRISLSHTPPWCDARGVLNIHSVLNRRAVCTILLRSNWRRLFDNSLFPPTKFVALSHRTVFGHPRRETKRMRALMKASVSNEFYFSMWIARVVKHVKTIPYRFVSDLPCLT